MGITHSTVVATADDGTSDVGSDEWNADHVISGTVAVASGAVLSWNSGDVTLTHAANSLEIAGGTLDFADVTGRKIGLYGDTSYAIGVESSELRLASNGFVAFRTSGYSGTEILRAEASGNFNIGRGGASDTSLDGGNVFFEAAANVSSWTARLNGFGNAGSGAGLAFTKTRNAAVTGHTVVQSGDHIGELYFYGSDGTAYRQAGILRVSVDGTPGSSDMPARFVFLTSPDGSATPVERLRIASDGKITITDNTSIAGMVKTIQVVIDGGGSTITTGIKGDLHISEACTILNATLLADQSGSIVVDIWKDSYANYPPTVADTITAAAKPTLSSATKSQDTTLTGWTTTIAAGDILRFNVDSITTCTRVTLSLKVQLD